MRNKLQFQLWRATADDVHTQAKTETGGVYLRFPSSPWRATWFIVFSPVLFGMYYTCPSMRGGEGRGRRATATFAVAIAVSTVVCVR